MTRLNKKDLEVCYNELENEIDSLELRKKKGKAPYNLKEQRTLLYEEKYHVKSLIDNLIMHPQSDDTTNP